MNTQFREQLSKLELINPVDIKLVSDGGGEFPDGYKLTDKGMAKIHEFVIKNL